MTQTRYHPVRSTQQLDGLAVGATAQDGVQHAPVASLSRTEVGSAPVAKSVPCFVAGTRILTQDGLVVIEDLKAGDRILTRDSGYQALKWIGKSTRLAVGDDAPVKIAAGALGNHETISFSQNHRILVQSEAAVTLFGESEVLIKARDLVNNTSIRLQNDGLSVTYVHLLFDRHEIVRANGLDCESYHPSHETLDSFDPATQREILAHMPNSDRFMGYGYGPVARVSLREQEAKALLHAA